LAEDKRFINDNIARVFGKLVGVVKDMPFATFNAKLN
jgi:hypothetical protein